MSDRPLPPGPYGVVYADPPWRYAPPGREPGGGFNKGSIIKAGGGDYRGIIDHYDTMPLEAFMPALNRVFEKPLRQVNDRVQDD